MATMSSPRSSATRACSRSRSATAPDAARRSSNATLASWSVSHTSGTMIREGARKSARFTRSSIRAASPHSLLEQRDEIHRPLRDAYTRRLERGDLLRRRSRRARDDRTGVSHAASRRRRLAGDESDDRFLHLRLDERGRVLLVGATDLAHHGARRGLRVGLECRQAIDEVRAVDRVAADADTRRLPEAGTSELIYDFIRERSGTAHHADVPRRTNPSGDDPDLALARCDQTRAIRSDEPRATLPDEGKHARHVQHRHAFGDRHDELDPGVRRLEHRVRSEHRRHVDHRCVRAGCGDGVGDGVEDRHRVLEFLAPLPGRDAGHDPGAVLHHLLGVERAVAARDPLHDDGRVLVDEDAHAALPPFANSTAFFTASSMSDDAEKPCSARIFSAMSTFVPVSRITIGTVSGFCDVAVTMPLATSSVRVIPPKMLNRIAFTLASAVMILSAFTTFSGFEEPPMSRKLAGSPP